MIRASLIYVAITVLLALIDAYRIKKAKGVVENIDHKVSGALAGGSMTLTCVLSHNGWIGFWDVAGYVAFTIVGFVFIRLAIYDAALNIWRRMKIDYQSPTTSSYVDNHSTKLSFWEKRAIGLAGWVVMLVVHHLIFKI